MECTIRYTPQQNGLAERMNRTIIEKARCILLESNLEKDMWTEAVMTAVYLINRSPTRALEGKTPAEMWYGEKPNLKKLKVFGSLAYLHVPKELNPGKFDSRTLMYILVGYCPNGYRLWNPKENKILFGSDVIFDKSKTIKDLIELDHQEETTEKEFEEGTITAKNRPLENDQEICQVEEYPQSSSNEESQEDVQEIENKEALPRRSEKKKILPRHLEDYVIMALNAEHYVENLPQSVQEINNRKDKDKWHEALKEEIDSLRKNRTWTLVELPPGRKPK